MKERTRLISLILSFVMLAGCILPGLTLRVEATLTTSVYKTKYQEFINNEQWRPGTWWGDEKTPNLSHWQSWGCCAYVYDFAAYVYGNYSGLAYSSEFTPFTDPAQIKTGDIVHYYYDYWDNQSGSWKQSQHWFVVLERWGDTLYTAEGNFDHGIRVTDAAYYIADGTLKNRNNNTTYYSFDCYHYNGFIDDQLAQAYIAQCTPYKTYGTILVTKDGANINDRPCSAKTDAGIVTKIDAALNSEYTVTKVYKNTENNYWYEVMLSTYERGYIYSGNCTFTGNQLYADVVLVNTNIPAQQPLNASFRLGGNIYAPFSQLDATTVSMYNTANGKELASQKLVTSDLSEFEYSVAFLEPTTVRCEVYASVSYFDVASERYINSIKCVHTGQIQFSCTEHAFGDWTVTKTATCTAEGSRSRTCSICTETVTESIPVIEHSWQVTDYSGITCTNPAYENSRCVHCRQTKSERGEVIWSDWVEVCPEKTAPDRIETKKQYRFRDMGGDWTVTENGTLDYVSEWPAGFPTTADLYHAYNKTPLQDSETETRRVRVTSQENKNWLYYHWCRGSYTAGPINRRISNVYTDQYPCFHGFVSAHWVGFDASANAWNYSEPACCRDTYWYFQIPVYTQTYTVEERSAASGEWSSWSEWSDTAVSPSDTRQVETREVYRYITAGLADHSWDEGEIVKAPTVDAEGQLVTTCTVCGTKYTEVLPKLPAEECPHTSVQIVNKKDATCTEEGYTGDEICAVCSETLSTGESIPAAGHRWDDGVVTAPTCTEKGYTTYTCACGDSYRGNETPADGHSFGKWTLTRQPACTEKGTETRTCGCGETETRDVDAKGHSEVVDAAKEATCTETGLTEGKRCSVCNDILVEQEVIPVKDHSWNDGEVTKEPTEIAKGEKTFTCTICGEKKMEELPALEHVHKHESVVTAPTCTQPGYTTYTCACGDTYRGNEVPVTEHTYGDWVTVSEAGCTTTGMEIRSCICGEGETREIPALDHHYVNGACTRCDTKDPDYEVPTEPTEPEPTEPEPTEPEPTEPEPTEPEPTDPIEPEEIKLTRIAGTNRISTAIASANKLKEVLGVAKFGTILVANAMDFPDALSGSYLAAAAKAPILLYANGQNLVTDYIKNNLVPGGIVYILGGEKSVSNELITILDGIECERVAGSGRFATSLAIIRKADELRGSKPDKVLICHALAFADSLSASATGLPILLVNGGGSLNDDQKAYLESVRGAELYVIGGESSIIPAILGELNAYDANGAERVYGSGRELTSVEVAKKFFPEAKAAALADSRDFPDGLSGGPVAYAMNMPLLLTRENKESIAGAYVTELGITEGYIIGGTSAVPDTTANKVFGK